MEEETLDLDAVRQAWRAAHLVPLWESPTAHKRPPGPVPAHLWKWEMVRPMVAEALNITSPSVVERRVLQLVSPQARTPEDESTAGILAAAIQSLRPGESARPHRHSMNALRFVLEGSGAVTVVDGKPCPMSRGDLILNPAWTWHGHRHDGDRPVIWLDVLDVPLHNYLGSAKFQPGPPDQMPHAIAEDAFAAPNLVPEISGVPRSYSPVFRYPYADACAAVGAAPLTADGTRRVRYANPLSGGSCVSLLDAWFVQIDPTGQSTVPVRTAGSAVCCVVDGHGESTIGESTFSWGPNDVFTLPAGNSVTHRCTSAEPARLFVVTDQEVWARLGLLENEPAVPGAL